MAQHDMNIANQGFPATRADLNNALQALVSNSSGTSAPSTTFANQWWYDTTNNKMYIRNEANNAWIEVFTLDQTNNEWQLTTGVVQAKDSDGLALKTDDGTTRLFIKDSDGNIGLGTTSPSEQLNLVGSSGTTKIRFDGDSSNLQNNFIGITGYDDLIIASDEGNSATASTIQFRVDATERMRIDSSGRVMVGKTSTGLGNVGAELDPSGQLKGTAANVVVQYLNRTTSEGDLVSLRVDNTQGGNIGVDTGSGFKSGYFGNGDTCLLFQGYANNAIIPYNSLSLAVTDNDLDLGYTSGRFDDIYATNGTIQTSDQNEKQQIASLTDAEMTAAKAISKLFKTFKWNDSVAENGDNARTHTGVIAQQVETAMSDAGLDAGNYAFFISTTWWETQTEVAAVDAVEAKDAVYDDDGNLVSEAVEAVEAKEAYTRTIQYRTSEEAPEGATERNRKGIRYPELLSFIGAATEQRLTSIEARLDALEG